MKWVMRGMVWLAAQTEILNVSSGLHKDHQSKRKGGSKMKRLLSLLGGILISFPLLAQGTWVQQNSGTTLPLRSVFFVDSLYGWAVGGIFGGPDSGVILKTTDGGLTWLTVYTDSLSDFYGEWFISRQTGWVVGGRDDGLINDTTCQTILKTTDGGLTWQRQWNRNSNTNWRHLAGVCFIGNTGWATVYGWFDSVGVIIHTTDGGATWANQTIFSYRSGVDPIDIQFVTPDSGVCCGDTFFNGDNEDGAIWNTTNAGGTWTLQHTWHPGMAAVGEFTRLWMVDANHGWCAGNAVGASVTQPGRVVATTDGGASWRLHNPTPLQKFSGVYSPDNSWVWIGTFSGEILLTTDGGGTWQDDNSGFSYTINDIHGIDRRNAWAVGELGTILRYSPVSGVETESPLISKPGTMFKIAPNPFASFATVPGHTSERFALYDITGRKVGVYKGDRIGEGLSPGVYFLKPEDRSAKLLRIVKVR